MVERTKRLRCALVGVAFLALTMGAGSVSAQGSALIYTSVPQDVIDVLQDAYQSAHPGYTLEVFRGGTSAILARIAAESQAGAIAADLIWVADPSEIMGLKEEGLLLEHVSPETEALPEAYRDADNQYFAGRVLGIVIAYNTLLVSEGDRPAGWRDLLEARFAGATGWPTPANSGAAVVTVAALLQDDDFGEEFIAALGENGMRQLPNNGAAAQMTATGELMAAIGLDFQIRALQAEGSPVGYVYPADGAVFIPSPIAIFRDAPNQAAARHFVDYILSVEGQETLVREANFIPVRGDVTGPEGAPGDDVVGLAVDADFIAANRDRILQVFETHIGR
jgi:iron(III) transport system substrate-binding protein